MKLARPFVGIALLFAVSVGLFGLQRGGRRQSDYGMGSIEPSEFYFSRLRYNTGYASGASFGYRSARNTWSQDWPRADDDCLVVLRRLTRIDSPSPLNVVDIDDDRMYDFPWIYAVGVNTWAFTDEEAKRLREYLARGGFLMVDHFHGEDDWAHFMAGMSMVLPDAIVEDIPDNDPIYNVLYSIQEKFQIPGEVYVNTGRTYEKDGYTPAGGPFATVTGALWLQSAPTCISATRGSGRIPANTPRSFPASPFASFSITLRTR